jgi:1-acyl-sn-glycerol-3-phosphate acyltransferase
MIRTVFVWVCILISAVIISIMSILTYPFDRTGRVVHRYTRVWGRIALLANRVRVKMEGLEQVEGKGPYIFMANHQGYYDVFVLMGHLPFQFKWLAKKEIFSIPLLGWAMSAGGYISVDREGTRETVKAMNDAAEKIREGMSVMIFPEGSRTPDGSIQPFKKGGFTLAVKSKVPIVPIAITGSREIMAKDSMTISPGEIRVRIGRPIDTRDYSLKERNLLMEKVNDAISEAFELISGSRRT